jgi:hypothetical protein
MRSSAALIASALALWLAGCAGQPKKLYDGPARPQSDVAVVDPTFRGGFVLIRAVDGRSTYTASVGFMGAVAVVPGSHTFDVEVSHGMKREDAGKPGRAPPRGVVASPMKGTGGSLFSTKWSGPVSGRVEAGKVYVLNVGFDPSSVGDLKPVAWLGEKPREP